MADDVLRRPLFVQRFADGGTPQTPPTMFEPGTLPPYPTSETYVPVPQIVRDYGRGVASLGRDIADFAAPAVDFVKENYVPYSTAPFRAVWNAVSYPTRAVIGLGEQERKAEERRREQERRAEARPEFNQRLSRDRQSWDPEVQRRLASATSPEALLRTSPAQRPAAQQQAPQTAPQTAPPADTSAAAAEAEVTATPAAEAAAAREEAVRERRSFSDLVQKRYDERSAIYDKMLGDPEERKQAARSQIMFAIAERGLALASGVTPSGQRMSGSLISQIGQAMQGLPSEVSAAAETLRKEDRAVRMAKLQAAEQDVQQIQAAEAAAALSAQETEAKFLLEQLRGEYRVAAAEARASGKQPPSPETLMPLLEKISSNNVDPSSSAITSAENAFGFTSNLAGGANTVFAPFGWTPGEETSQARSEINSFNQTLARTLAAEYGGKPSNWNMQTLLALLPEPGVTTSKRMALDQYKVLENKTTEQLSFALNSLARQSSSDKREETQKAIDQMLTGRNAVRNAINGLSRDLDGVYLFNVITPEGQQGAQASAPSQEGEDARVSSVENFIMGQ